MGVSLKNIRNIIPLVTEGLLPPRASILEYGTQNIHWSSKEQERELAAFISRMRVYNGVDEMAADEWLSRLGSGGLMGDLMHYCGFTYKAIDIAPAKNTILFDLNTDTVPPSLQGAFNLVTNFGTTEHVLNQYKCFETLHDFTADGGLMYHDLPMGGYFFHGYFSYTPMFFFHLAQANEYDILYRYYWKAPGNGQAVPAPAEITEHGWPESWHQNWGIEFIFRKRGSPPFRVPVEIGTSGVVDMAFLERTGTEFRALKGKAQLSPPKS